MKQTKRAISLLLTLVLLCTLLAVPAGAATSAAETAAQELYQMGLLQGGGTLPDGSPDFMLDDTATRSAAAAMLVRLLGGEAEAITSRYYHPFTDADWSNDYLGYLYHYKIAYGVSSTTFGVNETITAAQFLTMMLRAMGYDQVNWQDPYPTARAVGLDWSGASDFRRGDMAYICRSALSCRPKGSSQTLYQRLVGQNAIHTPQPQPQPEPEPSQTFTAGPVTPVSGTNFTVYSGLEAREKLLEAYTCRAQRFTLTCPVSAAQECENMVMSSHLFYADLKSISYSVTRSSQSQMQTIEVEPAYTDAVEIMAYLEGKRSSLSQENTRTLEKARQVQAAVVTPQMSEYDQVKAYHDYLVNNTTYGGSNDRRFNAAGALVDGVAVCDGYSMALDLLCYLSGIDCVRVTGFAGEGHAWNKVCINGSWYNIDVTWDDPVSSRPMLVYDYFLISDAAISRDHTFDNNPYWPAATASWPGR